MSPKKKSSNKKSHKNEQKQPSKAKKNASDADDDEVETSLSDELNHSWPSKTTPSKMKKTNTNRTLGIRRKRERKKDRSEGTSSGEDDTRYYKCLFSDKAQRARIVKMSRQKTCEIR